MTPTSTDSVEDTGVSSPSNDREQMPKGVLEELPWLDNAIDRFQFLRESVDARYEIVRRRISEIGQTSAAHVQQSVAILEESVGDAWETYAHYEIIAFAKLKGGIFTSVQHLFITTLILVMYCRGDPLRCFPTRSFVRRCCRFGNLRLEKY